MLSRAILLIMSLWLLIATAAFANSEFADSRNDLLARFDSNGDGRVIADEYVEYMMLGFSVRDTDANGVLEGSELPPGSQPIALTAHRERLQSQFVRQDTNKDGALSISELLAPPQ